MPACFTSTAREAPKEDRKLLVAAYMTVMGDTMAAAADDVSTKHPRSFLAVCTHNAVNLVTADQSLGETCTETVCDPACSICNGETRGAGCLH